MTNIIVGIALGSPCLGGGIPEFLILNGVLARLLKGYDNQPLQGADGQYLYGVV